LSSQMTDDTAVLSSQTVGSGRTVTSHLTLRSTERHQRTV
jgi:hypothetical protein